MPSLRLRPLYHGALSVSVFGGVTLYVAIIHAACSCYDCSSGSSCADQAPFHVLYESPLGIDGGQGGEFPSAEFRVGDRWDRTASEGAIGRAQGRPATVTWGIVADGTSITGSREGTSPSDLIAMLNRQHGASPTGLFEDAPWFRFFQESFDRWSDLSGVTYVYEPNDGGAPIVNNSGSQAGVPGQYADSRIGGHFIGVNPEGGNTLAYNYFPNHGDMVIDTDDASFFGNSSGDYRRLRNTLMHEAGHGLGFSHVESSNSGQLMEPFIQTSFDGPQIDDILAVHRNYGDVLEKDPAGSNDSARTPTRLGDFGAGDRWSIGSDGRNSTVGRTDTDFVSIDGQSDVDFFLFNVSRPSFVDITLFQVGRAYNEGPQDGEQESLVASRLNPLELTLLSGVGGRGIMTEAVGEVISRLGQQVGSFAVEPGRDYYVQVNGTVDNVQLYELNLAFTEIPEPAAVCLLATALGWRTRRRRSA